MRVCLDTNVLISGIFWKGIPGKILDLWVDDRFDLIGTLPVLGEYQGILRRLGSKIDASLVETWNRILIEKLIVVIPDVSTKKWSRDTKDDKFIQAAIGGKADYLVTGDLDLLELKASLPFQIVKPRDFLSQANT